MSFINPPCTKLTDMADSRISRNAKDTATYFFKMEKQTTWEERVQSAV